MLRNILPQFLQTILYSSFPLQRLLGFNRPVGSLNPDSYMHDQLHFADATGDAVIISAGKDGEMVFTRKPKGDGFLVSTNFNVANPSNCFDYPCWRYDKASDLLKQLIAREGPVTSRDARDIMDAVHVSKGSSWTLETMVADLVHGNVYIYIISTSMIVLLC